MKCIIPIDVTNSILISSTLLDTISASSTTIIENYSATTTYNIGNQCLVDHVIYTCLADGTINVEPSTNISEPTGPTLVWSTKNEYTNKWKMFDQYMNTSSETLDDSIIVELDSSGCDGLSLFNVTGTDINFELYSSDNTLIYSGSASLLTTSIFTWEQFFFAKRRFSPSLWIDFPLRSNSKLKFTISGSGPSVGKVVLGEVRELGSTMFDPKISKTDYSKYSTDDFGQIYLSKGKASRNFNGNAYINTEDLQAVETVTDDIRAVATAFACGNAVEDNTGLSRYLLFYGYLKNFEVTIPRLDIQECAIEINGII